MWNIQKNTWQNTTLHTRHNRICSLLITDICISELVTEKKYDEIRKSYLCFLKGKGECIELIEPTRESELCPLMKKYVNTPYHICYKVDNLQAAISKLKEIGFLIFKDIEKAPVISSHAEVAFLMHSRIGIIELVQGVE